jgi:hypothetical protein
MHFSHDRVVARQVLPAHPEVVGQPHCTGDAATFSTGCLAAIEDDVEGLVDHSGSRCGCDHTGTVPSQHTTDGTITRRRRETAARRRSQGRSMLEAQSSPSRPRVRVLPQFVSTRSAACPARQRSPDTGSATAASELGVAQADVETGTND